MDIRALDPTLTGQQPETVHHRVMKNGAKFPKIEPETLDQNATKDASGVSSVVTPEEKDFFASLFPELASETTSRVTYSPDGLAGPVHTGQMVDRKG